jgi:hypothetical protein
MRLISVLVLALACTTAALRTNAQQVVTEHDGRIIVKMSMCRTTQCVRETYAGISKPENLARVAYYSSLLALQPESKPAACGLLRNMPRTGSDNALLAFLATSLYPGESVAEIKATGPASWNFSRNLAHALKLCPQYLPEFIQYGTIALSPTSSYPNWAGRVCRSNPKRFLKAYRTLSAKDQRYITKYVIHPNGCKQIAFPEVP